MKFIIGFTAGLVVGGLWVSNSTEHQRRQVREAAANAGRKVKSSRIGHAVDENASKVATTASERLAGAVDSAGDALTDVIGDRPDHASA